MGRREINDYSNPQGAEPVQFALWFFDAGPDPFSRSRARRSGWHVDYYRDGRRIADSNRVWHQRLPSRRDARLSVARIAARTARNLARGRVVL